MGVSNWKCRTALVLAVAAALMTAQTASAALIVFDPAQPEGGSIVFVSGGSPGHSGFAGSC